MRRLIYSMPVSLDGFINGPDGKFDWAMPDEEVHRFHNEEAGEVGVHLLGRRMWETLKVWDTPAAWQDADATTAEFAEIWRATPKLVFSRTLEEVDGPAKLIKGDPVAEVARLKGENGKDLVVGGAGLAGTLAQAGLIDEYRLVAYPVIAGGGTPFFPDLEEPIQLELLETRTFASAAVYLRYRVR